MEETAFIFSIIVDSADILAIGLFAARATLRIYLISTSTMPGPLKPTFIGFHLGYASLIGLTVIWGLYGVSALVAITVFVFGGTEWFRNVPLAADARSAAIALRTHFTENWHHATAATRDRGLARFSWFTPDEGRKEWKKQAVQLVESRSRQIGMDAIKIQLLVTFVSLLPDFYEKTLVGGDLAFGVSMVAFNLIVGGVVAWGAAYFIYPLALAATVDLFTTVEIKFPQYRHLL